MKAKGFSLKLSFWRGENSKTRDRDRPTFEQETKAIARNAYDFDTLVGGTPIDDNVFDVGIALKQHGADGFLNKSALVVARSNDRDARPLRSVATH